MGRPPKEIRIRLDSSTGRYRVGYLEEPDHDHLSPETDPDKALAWAKRSKGRLLALARPGLTLAPFLEDFFVPGSPWEKRMREKGHKLSPRYLETRQGHLDNHIKPLLGHRDPRTLKRREIDDAILCATKKKGRWTTQDAKPLASATKYKLLVSLSLVLEDMVDEGVLEVNPMIGIAQYSKAAEAPREALPRDAFPKMFPPTHAELTKIWGGEGHGYYGGSIWGAMMLVFYDTGMRTVEMQHQKWGNLYLDKASDGSDLWALVFKGAKGGPTRAVGLSLRTAQELLLWKEESKHNRDVDYIFTQDGIAPVSDTGIVKAFRRGLVNVGLHDPRWTPYWLRHSFVTYALSTLGEADVSMLAGHSVSVDRIYQHADIKIALDRTRAAREKLERARG